LPFRYVFLLSFVFFMFSTAGGLWMINAGIKPTLTAYAETQTEKIGTMVINKAITKKIANGIDVDKLMEGISSEDGIQYNTEIINRVQSEITNLVQLNLKEAERGNLEELEFLTDVEIDEEQSGKSDGIVYSVPLGQATNNALLANLGPQIPIRFNAIGAVQSNLKTDVESFGINNAIVKVFVQLKVDVQIIIPFATETTSIEQEVLIAMREFKGEVPQFYNNGGESSPSIEVPVD
jgi:sporulation protein YunB